MNQNVVYELKIYNKYLYLLQVYIYNIYYILVIHSPFLFVYARLTKQCNIYLKKYNFLDKFKFLPKNEYAVGKGFVVRSLNTILTTSKR